MNDMGHQESAQRELDRIVDRLKGMPLNKLTDAAPTVREYLTRILYLNKQVHPDDPTNLPAVGDHALPDQLRVIANDVIGTQKEPELAKLLTDMRRALP